MPAGALLLLVMVAGASGSANVPPPPTIWTLTAVDSKPGHLTAGFLNEISGELAPAGELALPAPTGCAGGSWDIGAGQGQGSTMFLRNRSLFFLAQEVCGPAAAAGAAAGAPQAPAAGAPAGGGSGISHS
jgi:hypothetical protein